jgi:LPS export ABC transporter protein LptC/lipopolysaccharide transport protein LptA
LYAKHRSAGAENFSGERRHFVEREIMRLERILTHRLIRAFRVLLPALVLVLIAIPAWNYFARRANNTDLPTLGRRLPTGVSVHTEGFTYSRTEGGRTQFTVHARQSVGSTDNKYVLEDVDVTVFGAMDTDPTRKIRSKRCTYDQESGDFACHGNVEMELDKRTIVRTEELTYTHSDGIVTAPQHATLEQNGTTGRAERAEYGLNTGLMKLDGDVKIRTADNAEIETSSVLFHQKENWTTMSGGVLIKSARGWIRGSAGRAELEPETYKPTKVTLNGAVTAESRSQSGAEIWKLRAGWLEAGLSAAGFAENVYARENAEVEKTVGEASQRLSGGEIDTTVKEDRIDVIVARQSARMVLGIDQTLDSTQIWTNASGSIRTTDNSALKVGDSTIEGRDFLIENGRDLVTFNTLHRAVLKKTGDQESSSDQTQASFDSRTNMLQELVQTGHFRFSDARRQAEAQKAVTRVDSGATVVTLEGSPFVTDADKRLEALEIRLNQKDNSFVATRNVSTLMKNGEEPILVKAARAEGGAESVLYTGNVQLWRGEAYVKADRIEAAGQAGKNSRVHAEALPGSTVQSNLQNIRATSHALDYDDVRGVIRYTGQVQGRKQDMIIETPDMTVSLQDKGLREIIATGGVVVTRADQRGTGEHAVYDAVTDVVTLTGKNAQVHDKEHSAQGSVLTMRNQSRSASVESRDGERTTTKHPIRSEKK